MYTYMYTCIHVVKYIRNYKPSPTPSPSPSPGVYYLALGGISYIIPPAACVFHLHSPVALFISPYSCVVSGARGRSSHLFTHHSALLGLV